MEMRPTPTGIAGGIVVLVLAFSTATRGDDAETAAMAAVRLTTEPALAGGCQRLGAARDDSVKDLRRKIVRMGGNLAVLSFSPRDMSTIHADVFRCTRPATVAPPPSAPPANVPPSTPALPPNVPPPPPGPPPPPPPPGR